MCSIVEEGLIPGSAMEVEQVPNVDSVQMLIQPDTVARQLINVNEHVIKFLHRTFFSTYAIYSKLM